MASLEVHEAKAREAEKAKLGRVAALLANGWDKTTALALIYTATRTNVVPLLRRALEKLYGEPNRVTLAHVRLAQATIKVGADNLTDKPALLTADAANLNALLAQQLLDLLAAALKVQLEAAQAHNAKPGADQVPGIADERAIRWTDTRVFGGPGVAKRDFENSAEQFLQSCSVRHMNDIAMFAAQHRDADAYELAQRQKEEKKNEDALRDEDVRKKIRDLERDLDTWIPSWVLCNGWQLQWLQAIINKGKLPVESRLEAENLKPFADRAEKPVPCADKETAESTLSHVAVPDAPRTMAEVFNNARMLWMSMLVLGHGLKTSSAIPAERGGGKPLITPLAAFAFLDMLAVAMGVAGMNNGVLWTMRDAVMRDMRAVVNEEGASFDYALRIARRTLWAKILEFREVKIYHFGGSIEDSPAVVKKTVTVDPKTIVIDKAASTGGDASVTTDAKRASESWEAACLRHKKNRDRLEEELKKKTEECKKLKDEIKDLKNRPRNPGGARPQGSGSAGYRGRETWRRERPRERSWSNENRNRGGKRARDRSRS